MYHSYYNTNTHKYSLVPITMYHSQGKACQCKQIFVKEIHVNSRQGMLGKGMERKGNESQGKA
jgi:hypothetical protein